MPSSRLWGIHAGKTGDADGLFLGKSVIAIGWSDFGPMNLPNDRGLYKKHFQEAYPGAKAGRVATCAGQMYRFVHDVQVGDAIAYPSKTDRQIHLGLVNGPYSYNHAYGGYPNQRTVSWNASYPRTAFSNGALFEIGSALSLFRITVHAAEFLNKLGKAPAVAEAAAAEVDEPPAPIDADEVEDLTRDFVIKQLSKEYKGLEFERFVMHLLERLGYRVRKAKVNAPSNDLVAHRDVLGLEPPVIRVEVKSSDGQIGDKDVSAVAGKLKAGEAGLVIALGGFTHLARTFAESRPNLRLLDGDQLVDLVLEHYESFHPEFKTAIPVRRVYVPDVAE
jgi:restriction system protein